MLGRDAVKGPKVRSVEVGLPSLSFLAGVVALGLAAQAEVGVGAPVSVLQTPPVSPLESRSGTGVELTPRPWGGDTRGPRSWSGTRVSGPWTPGRGVYGVTVVTVATRRRVITVGRLSVEGVVPP